MTKAPHLALLALLALSACGNDPEAGVQDLSLKDTAGAVFSRLKNGRPAPVAPQAPDPNAVAMVRGALEKAGTPVYALADKGTGLATFVAKVGDNGGVETWSTTERLTVSLRDGIIVATRGFGADIMSADAPSLALIASGAGTHSRTYYYLDGADQQQSLSYDCSLSVAGSETIVILGKSYGTRHIVETCQGKNAKFSNEYWFDGPTSLRQSSQLRVESVGNMFLQKIIG